MQSVGVFCIHRMVICLKTVMFVPLLLWWVVDCYCQAHPRSVSQSDEYLRVEKEFVAVPFSKVAEYVEGLLLHLAT